MPGSPAARSKTRPVRATEPLFDFGLAVERVAAAVQVARALPFPFTLTARTENFLRGNPNLDDTIKRLQAFEKAGADALFAPLLPDLAAVRAVCSAVSKPVNFMVGVPGKSFSVAELTAAGVKRISLATSLYRAAMTGLHEAAREVKEQGTFTYLDRLIDVNKFMRALSRHSLESAMIPGAHRVAGDLAWPFRNRCAGSCGCPSSARPCSSSPTRGSSSSNARPASSARFRR